jgi:hypothetical protein
MLARALVASLGLTLALAAAACRSSGAYGTATNAAIGTGLAVGAAAINRAATHECWAACRPGTVCDKATGLCVEPGHLSKSGGRTGGGSGTSQPAVRTGEPYPPGHEYEVPAVSTDVGADAGCAPGSSGGGDGGALYCEMDGAAP